MKNICTILLVFFANSLFAQQISFKETTHDFGSIGELSGMAFYRFVFTNTSDKALVITDVKSTCGCTTPSWSRKPIQKGQSGYIDVNFDPRGRVGNFTKSIIVSSNSIKNNPTNLFIEGTVLERNPNIAQSYPYRLFDLRLKTLTANFGNININANASCEIEVFNPTDADLVLEEGKITPGISLKFSSSIIKPNKKAFVKINFSPKELNQYDLIEKNVEMLVNTMPFNLNVKACIVEDYDEKNPPILQIDKQIQISKQAKEYYIPIKNIGSSPLYIRNVRNTSGLIKVEYPTNEIIEDKIKIIINPNVSGKKYISVVINSKTISVVELIFY